MDSIRSLPGVLMGYQDFIRTPDGLHQESIRSLSGVHQEYQDFIRTPDGLHQEAWGSVTYSQEAWTMDYLNAKLTINLGMVIVRVCQPLSHILFSIIVYTYL